MSGDEPRDYKYGTVSLISKYWSKYQFRLDSSQTKCVFVGDVHGDLNQLLPPLIATNTITITGESPRIIDQYTHLYLPHYTVNEEAQIFVIFLGDLVDEGPCSRECAIILADVLEKCENVRFCFGNHDLNILSYWGVEKPDIPTMLPSFWNSLKQETLELEGVSVHVNSISPPDYALKYWRGLADALKRIFDSEHSGLCFIGEKPDLIFSHTVINDKSINELLMQKSRRENEELRDRYLGKKLGDSEWKELVVEIQNSHIVNKRWCSVINKLFKHSNCEFLHANKLTYNRIEDFAKCDCVIGHTFGGLFRIPPRVINPIPCLYDEDRELHLKPSISKVTKKHVLYFDFACSCGTPIGGCSRPDFVYVSYYNELKLSRLHGIVITYDIPGNLILIEYAGKTKYDGAQEVLKF